jgi:ArsR family transcriptional regulator
MATRRFDTRLLARRFYALGDEIRLEILGLLRGGERCVCELTAHLQLAQSRLSFHLKVLKDAGLISHRREGRWSYYALDGAALRESGAFLSRVPTAAAAACCQPGARDAGFAPGSDGADGADGVPGADGAARAAAVSRFRKELR